MLTTIPPDTYPLKPSATVSRWQAVPVGRGLELREEGRVPLWVGFHDAAGGGRKLTVLLVRIRPDMEIMLVSDFREDLVWEKTEHAIKERLTKPNWPDRSWYLSHIIYMAQPPKRQPSTTPRERKRPWFARFCAGRLFHEEINNGLMLAFVPLRRLKLVATPGKKEDLASADVSFDLDPTMSERKNVVRFIAALMELERWEQKLVHKSLGHLLGLNYLALLFETSERFAMAAGFSKAPRSPDDLHERLLKRPGDLDLLERLEKRDVPGLIDWLLNPVDLDLRKRLVKSAEDFCFPEWIAPPEEEGVRLLMTKAMFKIRFPLAHGPDPEYSVRPWLPQALKDIILMDRPIYPAVDCVTELVPMRDQCAVLQREVLGALGPYAPPSETA